MSSQVGWSEARTLTWNLLDVFENIGQPPPPKKSKDSICFVTKNQELITVINANLDASHLLFDIDFATCSEAYFKKLIKKDKKILLTATFLTAEHDVDVVKILEVLETMDREDLIDEFGSKIYISPEHRFVLNDCSSRFTVQFMSIDDLKKRINSNEIDRQNLRVWIRLMVTCISAASERVLGLANDFVKMINQPTFCDVTLIIAGQRIPANKCILAARSSYFDGLFRSGMKENEDNCIEIQDVDDSLFKQMLKFIYTSQVDGINDICEDLSVIADRFDVEDLKKLCEDQMIAKMIEENASKYFRLAEDIRMNKLRAKAIKMLFNGLNQNTFKLL